ncbi:sialin-like [Coccinella septempunctata]|uniref:sialin-like n=1 Tax=Coccinella septempunctata TaxID=41139 RepID=UPI001D08859E|nr:sialin-like [Coccinella septempunctata]
MIKIPYRSWIGFMIFWSATTGSFFLGHFQMSILVMIDKEYWNKTLTRQNYVQKDYGPRYNWTMVEEGQLISSYYYGLAIMSLPGGILADLVGPYRSILVTNLMSAAVTSLAVPLSGNNWIPLFVCRFIVGLGGGIGFPALSSLIAKWAPPKEKAIFTSCILGFVFGSLVTPPIAFAVIRYMGWQWSFYLTSLSALLFCVVWFFIVSDYPLDNWFCPKEEAGYIDESLEGTVQKGWVKPPIWKMITSLPFLVLAMGHFGVVSGMFLVVTLLPKFLDEALEFDLEKVGTMAAIPNIGRLIAGFTYGIVVGILMKRYGIDKKYLRKGFVIFSHMLPGTVLSIFLLNFLIEFGHSLAIALLIISTLCASSAVVTTSVNPQDLAPNFAGTQIGIIGFVGATAGFIYPSMLAKITEEKSDLLHWSILFGIIGGVYLFTGSMFIIFGSTSVQPWNEKKAQTAQNETS